MNPEECNAAMPLNTAELWLYRRGRALKLQGPLRGFNIFNCFTSPAQALLPRRVALTSRTTPPFPRLAVLFIQLFNFMS